MSFLWAQKFGLRPKYRFFRYRTLDFVNGPFVALSKTIDSAPSDLLCDFCFQETAVFHSFVKVTMKCALLIASIYSQFIFIKESPQGRTQWWAHNQPQKNSFLPIPTCFPFWQKRVFTFTFSLFKLSILSKCKSTVLEYNAGFHFLNFSTFLLSTNKSRVLEGNRGFHFKELDYL